MKKYLLGLVLFSPCLAFAISYSPGGAPFGGDATFTTVTVSTDTVNVVVASSGTFTNQLNVRGPLGLGINAAPRTNVTPSQAGDLIFNSTDSQLCMSTATNVSAWVIAGTTGTKCNH